ncbi:MAG: FeoB small GTPase domain-containing protein, partial [Candidatus Methanomethylophilaceae archaeon]
MKDSDKRVRFALIGQPNVGKSALFTRLTGVGVISSNYPGTTVEFEEGTVTRNGITVSVHDLPGTYGLSGNSDDEKVVLRDLYSFNND